MTKIIAQTYTLTNGYRAQITYALLGASLFLGLFYAMNVYTVISHTVSIQQVGRESAALSSSLQELDGQYLDLANRITPDALRSHGMTQGKVSAYISRTPSLGRVALGGHEL